MMMGNGKQLIGSLKPQQEPKAKGSGGAEVQMGQLIWKSGFFLCSMEQGYRLCCSGRWGQSGTVQGSKGPAWVGECQSAFVVLSSERRDKYGASGQKLGLGWILEKKFPFASKLIKCTHHTTGLQSEHKHVFWSPPAEISAVVPVG